MNFSCVYSFQCKDKEVKEFYIGSTKEYSDRRSKHKYKYNNNYTYPLYQFIRQNGGWDNWEMIVEVKTDDLSKDDRLILEQVYKDLLEPTLNSYNIIGDDEEKLKKNNNNSAKNRLRKVNCPHCNKIISHTWLKKHIKIYH